MSELKDKNEAACGGSALTAELGARPVNCDQVAWMLDAIGRYLPQDKHPRISRAREMQKYGLLYELMEAAHLKFADASARWNGTPNEARDYGEGTPNAKV